MSDTPNTNDFVNAIGAMAEMSWVFYSTSLKRGFTAAQALQLTQTYLSSTIMRPPFPPIDNEPLE